MSENAFPECIHDQRLPWSVGEVNRFAREVVHAGFGQMIWVKGALTRISVAGRHLYSSLKDEEGNQLKIVYFNGASMVEPLKLDTGSEVMVCGSLDIYVPGGSFQLMVVQVVPTNTTGMLMQQFLALKEKLESEGLFNPARKRPLPKLPGCIAVITSLDQGKAAVHDFMDTALQRVPALHIRMVGSKMQGNGTADNIVRIIDFLNRTAACDVIVITRGGGSMEDLWEFNNEALVRQVAASNIPVVTAIGHQIDQTLVDFAADAVAITPTDAAVRITEYAVQAAERLHNCGQVLTTRLQYLAANMRSRLTRAASSPYLKDPRLMYYQKAQRLAELATQLEATLPAKAQAAKMRIASLVPRLTAVGGALLSERRHALETQTRVLLTLDPKGVLQRGYSIILDEQGRAVRAKEDVAVGTHVKAVLARGELKLQVEE